MALAGSVLARCPPSAGFDRLKETAMFCMSGYQIVDGYFRDDGTWVSPYLRGVPNGIEFDNIDFDTMDLGMNNHGFGIDLLETDTDPRGENTDLDDLGNLG
jgi:hypothetical protein